MNINTHLQINRNLCGTPLKVDKNHATVQMLTTSQMAADEQGLVHGGFVFGMADYAAMLAVNDPFVVLGGTQCAFQKPVRAGETLLAYADVVESNGRKNMVRVEVRRHDELVFSGEFACFVLDKHVLAK